MRPITARTGHRPQQEPRRGLVTHAHLSSASPLSRRSYTRHAALLSRMSNVCSVSPEYRRTFAKLRLARRRVGLAEFRTANVVFAARSLAKSRTSPNRIPRCPKTTAAATPSATPTRHAPPLKHKGGFAALARLSLPSTALRATSAEDALRQTHRNHPVPRPPPNTTETPKRKKADGTRGRPPPKSSHHRNDAHSTSARRPPTRRIPHTTLPES